MGDVAHSVTVAMIVLWSAIGCGFVYACVSVLVQDRREARRWTERDDRAVQLEAKRHQS